MKSLFAFGLPVAMVLTASLPAAGQIGSQHALGGSAAAVAQSRPLGGISRGGVGGGGGGRRSGAGRSSVYAFPYAYSFYVPNYFDDSGYGYGYGDNSYPVAPPPVAPPVAAAPPAPPVIINQFFGTMPPQYQGAPPAQGAAGPAAADDQAPPVDHHYLLAYKNHTVLEVLAYWVEDKTMNYVTAGNKHNQASLDLIDMDLTKTLNEGR